MTLERREHVTDAVHELQNLILDVAAGAAINTKISDGRLDEIRDKDTIKSVLHGTAGVFVDLTSEASISETRASGTFTFGGNVTDGESVTVNGQTFTFIAGLTSVRQLVHSGGANVPVGVDANTSAASLNEAFNLVFGRDHPFSVTSSVSTNVVTVTAKQEGAVGNSIPITEATANVTVSGATLAGGTDTGGIELDTTTTTGDELHVEWYQKQRQLSPN